MKSHIRRTYLTSLAIVKVRQVSAKETKVMIITETLTNDIVTPVKEK